MRRTHVAAREGGLRNLQDTTCWRGGQSNQRLWFGGKKWTFNCETMHPCFCGMSPRRMAYWCPKQCRPSCGGDCATPQDCPSGFNIVDGQLDRNYKQSKIDKNPYPNQKGREIGARNACGIQIKVNLVSPRNRIEEFNALSE